MFCPKCGASLVDGARFCQKCGFDLSAYQNENHKPEPEKAAVSTQQNPAEKMTAPKSQPDATERKGAIPFSELMKSPIAKFGLICAIIGAIEAFGSMLMCPTSSGSYVSAEEHHVLRLAYDFWIPFVICGFVLALIGSLIMNLGPMVVGKAKEQKRKSLTVMFMVILAVALAAAVAFAVVRVAIEYADSNTTSQSSGSVDTDRHKSPTEDTESESETTVNEEDANVAEVRDELVIDGIPLSKLIGMTQSEVEAILGESDFYDGPGFEYDNPNDYNDWIIYYTTSDAVSGVSGSANHFSYNGQDLNLEPSELIRVLGPDNTKTVYANGEGYSWIFGDYEIEFGFSGYADENGKHLPYNVYITEAKQFNSSDSTHDYTLVNNNISMERLIGEYIDLLDRVWGEPESSSWGYGVNFYDYGDVVLYYDAYDEITNIELLPRNTTLDGRPLGITGVEFRNYFGEPQSEGYAETYFGQNVEETGTYYYMEYDNLCKNMDGNYCAIVIVLDSRDGDIRWISLS